MEKVQFSSMNLKTNENTIEVTMENVGTFQVLQYLPINQKFDLIEITLQKAYINGMYNPLILDMYFNLYLVYLYTNLEFSDAEKADEQALYDTLLSNHVIDYVINAIPEEEYNTLYDILIETKQEYNDLHNSFRGIINTLVRELPEQAEKAQDIIANFDPQKFQNVLDFSKAANGGRPINE